MEIQREQWLSHHKVQVERQSSVPTDDGGGKTFICKIFINSFLLHLDVESASLWIFAIFCSRIFLFSLLQLPSHALLPSQISPTTPHQIRQRVPVRPGLLPHQQGGEGKSENIISVRISRFTFKFIATCYLSLSLSLLSSLSLLLSFWSTNNCTCDYSKWCRYDQWLRKVIRPLKTGDPQSWADQTGREKPRSYDEGPQEEEADARRGFRILDNYPSTLIMI